MNKISNKILLGILCVSLLAGSYTKVYAANDKDTETTVETEMNTELENVENEDELVDEEVPVEEESEEVIEAEVTQQPVQTTSTQNKTKNELVVDGQTYSGEVWVVIKSKQGKNTALKNGTEFIVEFEDFSFNSGYKQEVVLNTDNMFSATTQLPVGEYYVTTTAKFNGMASDASLRLETENDDGTVLVLNNNQEINFTIIGDVKMDKEVTTPTPEIVEEKQDNFWISMLKNNIVILILMAACGITLLVYRLKRDNQ